jgi:hypothetical protein
MPDWILSRLFDGDDQSKPGFAFQGTINWIHAVSLLADNPLFQAPELNRHFARVSRREINEAADTLVFEKILMAFSNVAALKSINADITHHYDTVRAAIISWYYSVYFTCGAMIAATSGANPESHSNTIKQWHSNIAIRNLTIMPFSLYLNSAVPGDIERDIAGIRGANIFDLNTFPEDDEAARGAVFSYLKGTAEYERELSEEKIRKTSEFRALGVSNFRTRAAKVMRDRYLANIKVNFLTQAFRFRGKANYRDSLFLSYGEDRSIRLTGFCQDLYIVAKAFLRMSAFYISRRVERGTWERFVDDLEINSRLSLEADILRI